MTALSGFPDSPRGLLRDKSDAPRLLKCGPTCKELHWSGYGRVDGAEEIGRHQWLVTQDSGEYPAPGQEDVTLTMSVAVVQAACRKEFTRVCVAPRLFTRFEDAFVGTVNGFSADLILRPQAE